MSSDYEFEKQRELNLGKQERSMYCPLHVQSHYSLQEAISKPFQITERCVEIGTNACAITDRASLAGTVSFMKACKGTCSCGHQESIHYKKKERCYQEGCECKEFKPYKIKPILGCQFNLTPHMNTVVVLAKNLAGWKALIKATSYSNEPNNIRANLPSLSLEELASYSNGNFIVLSGGENTDLYLDEHGYEHAKTLVKKYTSLFGKENFYLQVVESNTDIMRKLGAELDVPLVASPNSHYCRKEDASDHRVVLCVGLETTLSEVHKKVNGGKLEKFFKSNRYHIPDVAEVQNTYTNTEINNTIVIASRCEEYSILNPPSIPAYPYTNNLSGADYLRQLCKEGWEKKISKKVPKELHSQYEERVKYELGVITGYQLLVDYFLIVADYMNWARERFMCGLGRGSGAGSLVSDLLNITDIDPLQYKLLFERFYNAGRNTADRISLPDIDCDFPISRRPEVKERIKNRFGIDKVSEMITFSRMQGRGAIKDVLRAHETCSFEEMNAITEFIPDESEISDELQLMREATGEASIILWALKNNSEALKQWCYIDEAGEFQGPYAKRFAQAIRLEGTKRTPGKHAAGIVISSSNLSEVCPMVFDKTTKQLIAGMEMNDLEAMGHVKFDILGVAFLDKAMGVMQLLRTGRIG